MVSAGELPGLDAQERQRYARQLMMEGFGEAAQRRLKAASVLVVGVGGLGSPAATYLAAAGVGRLGLADADRVELSNLNRQHLHHTADAGRLKVESAAAKLAAFNPGVALAPLATRLDADNAAGLLRGWDFVVDATDSFASKFLVNDACVAAGVPFCHAGISGWQGQALTVLPGGGACYRCVFSQPPDAEAQATLAGAGVLGAVAGMLGAVQAAEAVKHLAGLGGTLDGALLVVDARDMQFRRVAVARRADCAACGRP